MHRVSSIVMDSSDFLKAAALLKGFENVGGVDMELVLATAPGVDADSLLSDICLGSLGIKSRLQYLEAGESPLEEAAEALAKKYVQACGENKPDMIISIGDGLSGLASSMAGGFMNVPVARLEAGLRSFDESSESERCRRWSDSQAAMRFASEPSGMENLEFEALGLGSAHLVGDLLLEALENCRQEIERSDILAALSLEEGSYGLVCFENKQSLQNVHELERSLELVSILAAKRPVVLHISPKTLRKLEAAGDGEFVQRFQDKASAIQGVQVTKSLSFAAYLSLLQNCKVVLSDAEGVQSEAAFFDVPCLFCGEKSARIFYEERGTTTLVRREPVMLEALLQDVDAGRVKKGTPAVLEMGTGVAEKIATLIRTRLNGAECGSGCGCSGGGCSC